MKYILNICMLCGVFFACNLQAEETVKSLFLFGLDLDTATRDEMREAIKKRGGKIIQKDCPHNMDVYDARHILNGAVLLEVRYTDQGKFAMAKYEFVHSSILKRYPNQDMYKGVDQLALTYANLSDKIAFKYGKSTYRSTEFKKKDWQIYWIINQKFKISLERYYEDKEVRLVYLHQKNFQDYLDQKHIDLNEVDFDLRLELLKKSRGSFYSRDAF